MGRVYLHKGSTSPVKKKEVKTTNLFERLIKVERFAVPHSDPVLTEYFRKNTCNFL